VLDLADAGSPAARLEPRRELRVAARELADLAVERGREEHRLALARQSRTTGRPAA
jgi:hypothetical protein